MSESHVNNVEVFHTMLLSMVEVTLSVGNMLEQGALDMQDFLDYFFTASAVMEILGVLSAAMFVVRVYRGGRKLMITNADGTFTEIQAAEPALIWTSLTLTGGASRMKHEFLRMGLLSDFIWPLLLQALGNVTTYLAFVLLTNGGDLVGGVRRAGPAILTICALFFTVCLRTLSFSRQGYRSNVVGYMTNVESLRIFLLMLCLLLSPAYWNIIEVVIIIRDGSPSYNGFMLVSFDIIVTVPMVIALSRFCYSYAVRTSSDETLDEISNVEAVV